MREDTPRAAMPCSARPSSLASGAEGRCIYRLPTRAALSKSDSRPTSPLGSRCPTGEKSWEARILARLGLCFVGVFKTGRAVSHPRPGGIWPLALVPETCRQNKKSQKDWGLGLVVPSRIYLQIFIVSALSASDRAVLGPTDPPPSWGFCSRVCRSVLTATAHGKLALPFMPRAGIVAGTWDLKDLSKGQGQCLGLNFRAVDMSIFFTAQHLPAWACVCEPGAGKRFRVAENWEPKSRLHLGPP